MRHEDTHRLTACHGKQVKAAAKKVEAKVKGGETKKRKPAAAVDDSDESETDEDETDTSETDTETDTDEE